MTIATATSGRTASLTGSVTLLILRCAAAAHTLPAMSLSSCYLAAPALASHVSPHTSKTPGPPAGGSIWATDVPGWITAIATVGLLVGAIITAIYAAKAFGKQSREVAILAEQNERDIAERHKAQAARVYTVVEDNRPQHAHPYTQNGSDFPVYDAQFWRARPDGLTAPEDLGMIPPGGRVVLNRQIRYLDAVAIILTFRDAAGARWIRMPDGTLEEQTCGTASDSILAALGKPIPGPAEPAPAADAAGQT